MTTPNTSQGAGAAVIVAPSMSAAEWKALGDTQKIEILKTKMMGEMAQSIINILPQHLGFDYFMQSVLMALKTSPKLLACTRASIFGSVARAAYLGLMPDGLFGEASLVPFYSSKAKAHECQLIPGYKGLRKMAMNTGMLKDIYAVAVYEGDTFEVSQGTDRFIKHVPGDDKDRRYEDPKWVYENLKAIYAVAIRKDDTTTFIVMSKAKIEARRKRAPSQMVWKGNKPDGPSPTPKDVWLSDYEKMSLKTGVRELCSTLELSAKLQMAVGLEESHELLNKPQHNSMLLENLKIPISNDIFDEVNSEYEEIKEEEKAKDNELQQNSNDSKINQGNSASNKVGGVNNPPASPTGAQRNLMEEEEEENDEPTEADLCNDEGYYYECVMEMTIGGARKATIPPQKPVGYEQSSKSWIFGKLESQKPAGNISYSEEELESYIGVNFVKVTPNL